MRRSDPAVAGSPHEWARRPTPAALAKHDRDNPDRPPRSRENEPAAATTPRDRGRSPLPPAIALRFVCRPRAHRAAENGPGRHRRLATAAGRPPARKYDAPVPTRPRDVTRRPTLPRQPSPPLRCTRGDRPPRAARPRTGAGQLEDPARVGEPRESGPAPTPFSADIASRSRPSWRGADLGARQNRVAAPLPGRCRRHRARPSGPTAPHEDRGRSVARRTPPRSAAVRLALRSSYADTRRRRPQQTREPPRPRRRPERQPNSRPRVAAGESTAAREPAAPIRRSVWRLRPPDTPLLVNAHTSTGRDVGHSRRIGPTIATMACGHRASFGARTARAESVGSPGKVRRNGSRPGCKASAVPEPTRTYFQRVVPGRPAIAATVARAVSGIRDAGGHPVSTRRVSSAAEYVRASRGTALCRR